MSSELIRLDKFLASQNIGSRKEVTALVKKGAVKVDGKIIKQSDFKFAASENIVTVSGEEIEYHKYIYIMMNKPTGVLSATQDKKAKTVLDLLPPELSRRGLFPAGRLDKNTTGLLIITDDGNFAHEMLAPKKHVYKLYEAITELPITERDIKAFETGVEEANIKFAPAKLWTETHDSRECAMVMIREGKFHQVKRMFEACNNKVIELKRLKIGKLELDVNLKEGEVRLLSKEEVASVFE